MAHQNTNVPLDSVAYNRRKPFAQPLHNNSHTLSISPTIETPQELSITFKATAVIEHVLKVTESRPLIAINIQESSNDSECRNNCICKTTVSQLIINHFIISYLLICSLHGQFVSYYREINSAGFDSDV